jgi:hypothetical protein
MAPMVRVNKANFNWDNASSSYYIKTMDVSVGATHYTEGFDFVYGKKTGEVVKKKGSLMPINGLTLTYTVINNGVQTQYVENNITLVAAERATAIISDDLTLDGTFIKNLIIGNAEITQFTFDKGCGGTLTLGGVNNSNGLQKIVDSVGNTLLQIDNTGITVNTSATGTTLDVNNGGISFVSSSSALRIKAADYDPPTFEPQIVITGVMPLRFIGSVKFDNTIIQPPWTEPADLNTGFNAWFNYDTTGVNYGKFGYFKDSLGFVHIKGNIHGGAMGNACYTLDAGLRPKKPIRVMVYSGAAAYSPCWVEIFDGGAIVPLGGNNDFIDLGEIIFKADQ